MKRGSKGFTLVEALVSATLVAVAVTGTMGASGALVRAQAKTQEKEQAQRLAVDKLDELLIVGLDNSDSSGTFEGANGAGYSWTVERAATSVENLEAVRVTVEAGSGTEASVETLLFTPEVAAQ